jgi:hypothetical protein
MLFFRLKSSLTDQSTPPKPTNPSNPSNPPQTSPQPIPQHIRKTIPGQTEQSNSLSSRLPKFPLKNNSTLLPKPGVPTAADTPLRSMMEILSQKVTPELIYEAESHKLYFLTCGSLALIFAIYGLTFTDWGFSAVWQLYQEDNDPLMFAGRLGLCSIITGVALGVVYLAVKFPTMLVRRIWFLPGPVPHIKWSSHPLLPGGATPNYTVPLDHLVRSQRSKVFTKNGIYGTLDKSTFFFLLKETDKKFGYWIVDRNGWFWGDGRVFDVLFGKESLEVAMKGQSYNEKLKEATDILKNEREKLRKQHGPFWQAKLTKEMMKNDLKKVVGIASSGSIKKTKNGKTPQK